MANTRGSRSDAGVIAITRAIFTNFFGLDAKTTSKVMKLIRNSGQLQDLKQSLRNIDAGAYKRLNQVIDVVQKQRKSGAKKKPADDAEKKAAPNQEEVTESFLNYLLTELQIDADELRNNPEMKQDAMRLARANDTQSASLQKRMSREKMMGDRKAIQSEQDPQKAQIRRRIMNLEKQLAKQRELLGGEADASGGEQGRM